MKAPSLFCKDDWNGFWALLADNLANLVIAAGVCKGLLGMPDWVVFGRIVPGLGVALLVGLSFYSWQAKRLAHREGRDDVTALPFGISTPVLFVYLFGVMAPIYFGLREEFGEQAGVMAWQAGVAAAFLGGAIEASGSVFGPALKRVVPRAGMLGTLAGIALVFIASGPFASIFEDPIIGFPALAVVLGGLVAGKKLPGALPIGLVAISLGTVISVATGHSEWQQGWTPQFHLPIPVFGDLLSGMKLLWGHPEILAIILPIEIFNFIETMNNVESAEAAGDKYDVRTCQFADGAGTMIGALFGAVFPTTVYIGHPAYKRLGSRIGYAWAVGVAVFLLATTGLYTLLYALVPRAAVDPLLVFVGVFMVAEAFAASPKRHSWAVGAAMLPHLSAILIVKGRSILQASKVDLTPELIVEMSKQGLHWSGHEALHGGAILSGLLWGGMVAKLIDGKSSHSAAFAGTAALLTAIGVIHAPSLSWNPWQPIVGGYVLLGLVFLAFRQPTDDEAAQSCPD